MIGDLNPKNVNIFDNSGSLYNSPKLEILNSQWRKISGILDMISPIGNNIPNRSYFLLFVCLSVTND